MLGRDLRIATSQVRWSVIWGVTWHARWR